MALKQGRSEPELEAPSIYQNSSMYSELFYYLVHVGASVPKVLPPIVFLFSPSHNPNVSRAFHAGYIGYTVKDCYVFKNKVQELIY